MSAASLQGRLLVADDVPDAARTLAVLCELYGAEVRVAFDGEEAISVAEVFRPEVILLDISMPRVDGYGAARAIRSREWSAGSILIALTGWGRSSDLQAALAAGFDGHVVKPVDPDALIALITCLRAKSLAHRAAQHAADEKAHQTRAAADQHHAQCATQRRATGE
jgi:CheY-like chemotaxis protein